MCDRWSWKRDAQRSEPVGALTNWLSRRKIPIFLVGYEMKATLDSMVEENETLRESETTTKSEADAWMSGATTPTEGSFSGEESFFDAIGADFRTLAISLKQTAGGVANFVQRSAMNVAAEITRLEENDIQAHNQDVDQPRADTTPLRLPWEVRSSSASYEEDSQLRKRILALSSDENTFLQPYAVGSNEDELDFSLDEPRVQLIRRLLDIDENLASTHALLSGRSDIHEAAFWKNYFCRCKEEREQYIEQHGPDFESLPSQNSLVPAEAGSQPEDENESSSFVLPSPPASLNSTGVRSVDSLVIVENTKRPQALS